MDRRIGIHDVAQAAGVSATTVSHALNGRGKVSAETRERVQRIADELGYAPNRLATALRRQRTDLIGLVADEIAVTPFAGGIVLGAQEAATELGMSLMIVDPNRDATVARRQLASLRAQPVDVLLIATMSHRAIRVPAGAEGIVTVLVNADDLDRAVPSIAPDEVAAGVTATELLLDAGHRRIAHLTIDDEAPAAIGREAGYRSAMRRAGLPPAVFPASTVKADASAGRQVAARALDGDEPPTAVFCFNDQMAMGAYQTAANRGLRVPQDLSVVGVDNLEIIAAHLQPGLTTLELPHLEMGRWGVQEAVRRLGGALRPPQRAVALCRVVERDSVVPPP